MGPRYYRPGMGRVAPSRVMRRISSVIILWLAWSGLAFPQARCYAIDGDTLQCGDERVRLKNVYAAERDEFGGDIARERLQRRIDQGDLRIVRRGTDKYGRTLAEVYAGGRKITQRDIGRKAGRGLRPPPGPVLEEVPASGSMPPSGRTIAP